MLNSVSFFCPGFQLSSTLNHIVFNIMFYRQPYCLCCSFKGLIKFWMLQMSSSEVSLVFIQAIKGLCGALRHVKVQRVSVKRDSF